MGQLSEPDLYKVQQSNLMSYSARTVMPCNVAGGLKRNYPWFTQCEAEVLRQEDKDLIYFSVVLATLVQGMDSVVQALHNDVQAIQNGTFAAGQEMENGPEQAN